MDAIWKEGEEHAVKQMLACSFIGSAGKIANELQTFLNETQVEEIMVVSNIFDHAARVHSYEVIAQITKDLITK